MSQKIEKILVCKNDREKDEVSYKEVDLNDYEAGCGEVAISHGFIMDSFRKIMGRTLTIIDASIVDKQQNKAMKDLLRAVFSDEMEFVADMVFDQKEMSEMANEAYEEALKNGEDLTPVTIEEALGVENN